MANVAAPDFTGWGLARAERLLLLLLPQILRGLRGLGVLRRFGNFLPGAINCQGRRLSVVVVGPRPTESPAARTRRASADLLQDREDLGAGGVDVIDDLRRTARPADVAADRAAMRLLGIRSQTVVVLPVLAAASPWFAGAGAAKSIAALPDCGAMSLWAFPTSSELVCPLAARSRVA